jgi:hypothetical protein
MARRLRSILGSLLLCTVPLCESQASEKLSVATHIAIVRNGEAAWLLRVGGDGIDVQEGKVAPKHLLSLRQPDGTPFRWKREPTSFARLSREWLFVNGTNTLHRFSEDGRYVSGVSLAISPTDVIVLSGKVWLYSAGPDGALLVGDTRLQFRSIPRPNTRASLSSVQRAVDAILIVAAGPREGLLYTHLIGPPILHYLSETDRREFPLAYRRTARRASLTAGEAGADQFAYSSPARDILSTSPETLLVLRNLEDEPAKGHGQFQPYIGRRADVYRMLDGAHLGTATFDEPIRWLLRISKNAVVAIARSGRVVEEPIGKPIAGEIF